MQLENTQVVGDVIKRLRRAEGQLAGVIRMMEAGRDCELPDASAGSLRLSPSLFAPSRHFG